MGNVDAGKSTLVGVLTSGQLDNGRGLARSRVFRMRHEQDSGRTSAISQHIFGFNTNNEAVHQPVVGSATAAAKTKSWRQVMQNSKSSVTLIDLAGHEKYLKTTIAGLTGMYVDYACLIVGGNMGISKMTKEHLGVALALEIPCFVVITKIDMTPPDVLKETVKQLFKILKSPAANKMPIIIRSAQDIETTVNSGAIGTRVCPIFLISSVKGTNVDLLMSFVSKLKPRYFDPESGAIKEEKPGAANEFDIDEVFQVAGVGVVVSGTVKNGTILLNQKLLLGPCSDSTFKSVMVKSIHMKRVPVDGVRRGDSCAMALRPVKRKDQFSREDVRRGMVLVDSLDELRPSKSFDAEVLVLTHHTTIKPKYQPVIHCGNIRQTAVVESIDKEIIRTGDKALVKFRFLVRPEYLHVGTNFVFREGNTKGIGKVLNVSSDA
eukprot:TRINITY_DN270_c0_g1_i2.p1 TRINITY_DN270_c0_g1~~TRINITY_DN270_c0_g1_i2.p1  ORF type:complete len:434 (+),score=120.80 TRINITY_DN270_c0_g1_i2:208-1509(+)